jgi:hypothetical protein
MDQKKSLDIDTPFDLELLKLYLHQQGTPTADLTVEHEL